MLYVTTKSNEAVTIIPHASNVTVLSQQFDANIS